MTTNKSDFRSKQKKKISNRGGLYFSTSFGIIFLLLLVALPKPYAVVKHKMSPPKFYSVLFNDNLTTATEAFRRKTACNMHNTRISIYTSKWLIKAICRVLLLYYSCSMFGFCLLSSKFIHAIE